METFSKEVDIKLRKYFWNIQWKQNNIPNTSLCLMNCETVTHDIICIKSHVITSTLYNNQLIVKRNNVDACTSVVELIHN